MDTLAHLLSSSEDGDIITAFLEKIQDWCEGKWRPRFILTDNSAAEGKAIAFSFQMLNLSEYQVEHYLCRQHLKETLKRNLAGDQCRESLQHMLTALNVRRSETGCQEELTAAIAKAPDEVKQKYLIENWQS